MNTFDYWFDYIIRNGEFVGKEKSFDERVYWFINSRGFQYQSLHLGIRDNEKTIVIYNAPMGYIDNLRHPICCMLKKDMKEHYYREYFSGLFMHRNKK